MKLGMQVVLGPGHLALDGDLAPLPKLSGTAPNFRPICCGQIAVWIKMPLGMAVDLGPGDFVLDGDPAPPHQKGCRAPFPNFGPMSIVDKRLYGPGRQLARRWALVQATLC